MQYVEICGDGAVTQILTQNRKNAGGGNGVYAMKFAIAGDQRAVNGTKRAGLAVPSAPDVSSHAGGHWFESSSLHQKVPDFV